MWKSVDKERKIKTASIDFMSSIFALLTCRVTFCSSCHNNSLTEIAPQEMRRTGLAGKGQ
jgi:hypothetical protein